MHPRFIILHHSLTKDSITVSWNAIRRHHIYENGWVDIGYHFGIELVGTDNYEIIMGRMLNETGAHCRDKSMNRKSLGICVIGNYDKSHVPDRQWRKTCHLVRSLMEIYNIDHDKVLGHREVTEDNRTCPGSFFDMDKFRKEIEVS
ncbi:hypothetical protein LCGC14_1352120 [marine sediment metagenome]|uniref:N-acetylmuramoyl-L-alanine amidase domain-containing protein n=1 Tax=marine sediment metagenome TaxID=412755 RepID=A0A0F9KAL9_9ZZZZ